MLNTDLSKFKPPSVHVNYNTVECNSSDINHNICRHFYNHSVTIVLPNDCCPKKIEDALVGDSEYYLISNCPVYFLVETLFIEAFVKKGEVTLLSVDTFNDIDNCFSVTPSGHLVLSINRSLFLSLGIDKGPAVNITRFKDRYLLKINLKESSFKTSKNNYKRVLNQLFLSKLSANVIVSWEPEDSSVCPSSIANYFYKKDLKSKECRLSYSENIQSNVNLPIFQTCSDELFEWLGLHLLGAVESKEDATTHEYLSSYQSPDETEEIGNLLAIQAQGLITSRRIEAIFNLLRDYIRMDAAVGPWLALHIQGFHDAPISWNLEPHTFGDNNFTVIIDKNGISKTCKVLVSLKTHK